jgi:hypothetical protein
MNNGVFWDVTVCGSYQNRRFGGTLVPNGYVPRSPIFLTLMMEALSSSATSVLTRATRRNIPADVILRYMVCLSVAKRRIDWQSYGRMVVGQASNICVETYTQMNTTSLAAFGHRGRSLSSRSGQTTALRTGDVSGGATCPSIKHDGASLMLG